MTENKNTLFRFVTLRGPELLAEEKRQQEFIFHPDPEGEGHFKDAIADAKYNPAIQREAQKDLAATLPSPFENMDDVKTLLGASIYSFSNWVAKNATAIAKGTVAYSDFAGFGSLSPLSASNVLKLWDNLFYQLIAGQAPEVQEQILQALIANKILAASATPGSNKIATAKVVIPRSFFAKPSSPALSDIATAATPSQIPAATVNELNGSIKIAVAKDRINRLQIAGDQLKQAWQSWERSNRIAYDAAKKTYDANVATIIRDAERTTDPADIRYVEAPEVPDFVFEPAAEMDPLVVNAFLSGESQLLATAYSLFSLPSFSDALERIRLSIQEETAVVFENSPLVTPVASVNNVLLPVSGRTPAIPLPYSYTIQPIMVSTEVYKIFLALECGYKNPAVTDLLYTAHYGVTNNTNGGYTPQVSGTQLILELFPGGLTFPIGTTSFTIDGRITLSSGVKLEFDAVVNIVTGGMGVMEADTTPDTVDAPGFLDVYIPSGFGMKRLGIADYRKVEQSTCCYVPGDVSHIENVMAREYKEKSTRRLRRSEETTTTETEMEKEQLTDTTTATRQDMQQEVASVIAKDSASTTSSSLSASYGKAMIGLSAGFSQNTSQQQSNSQAVSYAKDVTERALDRILQKVREERNVKIVEEYEEQNKHGFDNRRGDKHISGVYRWIDKIYKNKVLNYGKRLMYEFMLPQPAVFHMEAMKTMPGAPGTIVLNKPIDPRSADAGANKMSTFSDINEYNYKYWAAAYGAEIDPCPDQTKTIGKSFSGNKVGGEELFDGVTDLQIPENYIARSVNIRAFAKHDGDALRQGHVLSINVGNVSFSLVDTRGDIYKTDTQYQLLDNYTEQVPMSYVVQNYQNFTIGITVRLEASPTLINTWRLETFDAIIKAYEVKRKAYEDSIIANKQEGKTANPGFYRLIENSVLRKNCISYLVGHNNLGRELYSGEGVTGKKVSDTSNLDRYSSLVKFIEQAFEWEEISYTFYPYYWADKSKWQELYQQEVDDALFRSFLQSGMARVVASVRPGFEEAVMFYMATGQVWSGGQVPVIGDDLFLSIVDELKNPEYTIEEVWETRVPTALTVIQNGTIGLAADGLPCCHEDESEFSQNNDLIGGATGPVIPSGPPDEDGHNPPDSPSEPEGDGE